jgi:hypothetical protein
MKKFVLGLVGAAFFASAAFATNLPLFTGPTTNEPSQENATLNQLIQNLNGQITPSTMAPWAQGRNYLDNGDMWVDIRGTGAATCGTTTVPETAYSADRWGCFVNVSGGVGTLQVATSSPTPPLQFINEEVLVRASNTKTQLICAIQEVPSSRATQLQGKLVNLSAYVQALAGLNADNGNAFNMYIITGTGQDEGLQSFTASPAITPAFTGVVSQNTSVGSIPQGVNAFTATTSWARYNTGSVLIPYAVTELAVEICFTPTATGAGSTDGLAFTGVQLEQVDASNTTGPSVYEFKNPMEETLEAQRYAYAFPEPLNGVGQFVGYTLSTTGCGFDFNFPVPMLKVPTLSQIGVVIASGTTYKVNQGGALFNITSMSTWSANSKTQASFYVITGTAMLTTSSCALQGLSGGAIPLEGGDF